MDNVTDESVDVYPSPETMCDTGNFECNICFELANEPIVTLCGHLYCWPCLLQWLRHHSHSHECPVCKAIVQEEFLIPIYGKGKTNCDLKSQSIAYRPFVQRREAPRVDMNYYQPNHDLDDPMGFMPMAVARIGHMTLSTIFGVLPGIFSFQVRGFHDATLYGVTSGVPYLFTSSFHGGYGHGFHHYHSVPIEWKPIVWKIVFVILGFLILFRLIFA